MTSRSAPTHRVIVVAADPVVGGPIDGLLARLAGVSATRVPTPALAMALRSSERTDAILVDLAAVGDDEIGELWRQPGDAGTVAVIGLLRHDCPLRTSHALQAGAQECLVIDDLTPVRLERSLRQAIERQRVQQRLADMAWRDDLTGLYNRRGVLALGEYQRRQCLRSGGMLAVVQVDVDGLKTINDSWGHQAGDQAIAGTATVLRSTFRESDIVGRVGGDEFLALAVDAEAGDVHRMERRLADALGAFNCRRTTSFELSFSIGTSVLVPPASPTLAELIARADEALYRSKRTAGRRVAAWPTAVRPIAAA
jgi:two-component system, cell cycle response regulator